MRQTLKDVANRIRKRVHGWVDGPARDALLRDAHTCDRLAMALPGKEEDLGDTAVIQIDRAFIVTIMEALGFMGNATGDYLDGTEDDSEVMRLTAQYRQFVIKEATGG